jgi:hypothetical protein
VVLIKYCLYVQRNPMVTETRNIPVHSRLHFILGTHTLQGMLQVLKQVLEKILPASLHYLTMLYQFIV